MDDKATHPPASAVADPDPAPRRLVIAVAAAAVLLCALMAYWLGVLHDHRIQFTQRQVQQQTAALSEHAGVVLAAVDALLQTTVADVRGGRVGGAAADAMLRWRTSGNPGVLALELAAADGTVIASSAADRPPAPPAPPAVAEATPALHLRAESGQALTLARNVPDAPLGIAQVVARIDPRLLAQFFAHTASAADARFGLFSADGTRLVGNLDLAPLRAAGESDADVLAALTAPAAEIARGPAFVTAQTLAGVPLIGVTSRDRRAVLAPWFGYLASASLITVLTVGLLALVMRRLQHEMRARLLAQAALARSGEQSRRLEALGRLSGGIAHDFNNILAAILGYGDLLQQHVAPASAAARHAEQLLRAGERGRQLVARILSFSRGGNRPQARVAVQAVVAEALDLLLATAPAAVRIERHLGAPDAVIRGDATQLFEVVQNLCSNAIQAMQAQSGSVRVSVFEQGSAAAQTLSHGRLEAGRHVVIEVADSGPGIAADALEHLFEPFFTTRGADGGTGLGLAMVHGAMKDMDGAVDVRSVPGHGARFTVYLPRADGRAEREDAPPRAEAPRGSGQVIMVVDDEPALVMLAEEVLAGLGYEPAGFRDPLRALAVLREAPQRFDALLLDQVMPGMSGTELARQARALRPEVPILLASGFGGANLDQRAREAGVSVLLQKPLHRIELAVQLASAFERAKAFEQR